MLFQTTWPVPGSADLTYMVPTRAYRSPVGATEDSWSEKVSSALQLPPASRATCNLVQRQWHAFNQQVEKAFLQAHRDLQGVPFYGLFRAKGSPPAVTTQGELGKAPRGTGFRFRAFANCCIRHRSRCRGAAHERMDNLVTGVQWQAHWTAQEARVSEALELRHWCDRMEQGGARTLGLRRLRLRLLSRSTLVALLRDPLTEAFMRGAPVALVARRPSSENPFRLRSSLSVWLLYRFAYTAWAVHELKAFPLAAWVDFAYPVNFWFEAGCFL